MPFPWRDWQFWIVTAMFIVAAGYLLRGVLPVPFFSRRARARRTEHKALLTISAGRDKGAEEGGSAKEPSTVRERPAE